MGGNERRSRLAAIFLGSLLALGGFELALRAVGWAQRSQMLHSSGPAGNAFTVICLGNSFTAGTGAPPGEAYCDHLRRLLREDPRFKGKAPEIVNLGIVNANSAAILSRLESQLEQFHPQLALLMVGEPNYWNRIGYGTYLERKQASPPTLARLYDKLYQLRIFRFATIVHGKFLSPPAAPPAETSHFFPGLLVRDQAALGLHWFGYLYRVGSPISLTEEERAEAVPALEALAGSAGEEKAAVCALLGRILAADPEKTAQAADWFRKSMAADPSPAKFDAFLALKAAETELPPPLALLRDQAAGTLPSGLTRRKVLERFFRPGLAELSSMSKAGLAAARLSLEEIARLRPADASVGIRLIKIYLLSNDPAAAAQTALRLLRANPFSVNMTEVSMEALRLRGALETGGPANAPYVRQLEEGLEEFRRKFPAETYLTSSTGTPDIDSWLRSDLEAIVRNLEKHQVRLLLQTYPPPRSGGLRAADRVILRFAREKHYPLNDNLAHFENLFRQTGQKDRYYSSILGSYDDHLSSAGYRELAESLKADLLRYGLLAP